MNEAPRIFRRWSQAGLGVLFPLNCEMCHAPLAFDQGPLTLCDECCDALTDDEPCCSKCGLALPSGVASEGRCPSCRCRKMKYKAVARLGRYQGDLRAAVLRMKNEAEFPLAAAVAELLWLRRKESLLALDVDQVAPVPMYWRRRWRRGVNNPETLCETLSKRLGVPSSSLLVRKKDTQPQGGLSPPRRKANVRGAFVVRARRKIKGTRILLFDDVLTTGATCNEAAKILLKAGASFVAAAVIARTENNKP